jgi:hypothetical protein
VFDPILGGVIMENGADDFNKEESIAIDLLSLAELVVDFTPADFDINRELIKRANLALEAAMRKNDEQTQ